VAESLEAAYTRLLSNPNDYALNMAYGAAAEAAHELRHALAAYERAVLARPDDPTAREALQRVRLALLPDVTTVTVAVGANYVTNPREAPSGVTDKSLGVVHDGAFDTRIGLIDERTLLGIRWRSGLEFYGQNQIYAENVNYLFASAFTGPIWDLEGNWRVHAGPLTDSAWLGGEHISTDYGGFVTLSNIVTGLPQWVRVRAVYRDVSGSGDTGIGNAFGNVWSNGSIVDVDGFFQAKPGLVKSDALYVTPLLRFSSADGRGPASVVPGAPYDDPLYTADYLESGIRASYFVPVNGPAALFGVGIGYHHRWFGQNVAFSIDKRQDDFIEPSAHLIFPSLLAPNLDLRFDYRFEHNESNDALERFDNHVVGVHVVGRF